MKLKEDILFPLNFAALISFNAVSDQRGEHPPVFNFTGTPFLSTPSYHESASLSTLKAYNTVSWPGGAAISLYALASPVVYNVYPRTGATDF